MPHLPVLLAAVAGLNLGSPVTDGKVDEEALQRTIATGAPHVRVNFRLDRFTSPTDPAFIAAYDRVVDRVTSEGLEVYGLLNDELVTTLTPKSADFEQAWIANALAVVDRYKDRVRVWETLNEPNNWDETKTARVPVATFARTHAALYEQAKVAHASDACWDVALVTGPLFSFDGNPSTDYLATTIDAGRAGGAWQRVVAATGHDPIDGVGYHAYVAQGADSSDRDAATALSQNLDALHSMLDARGLGAQRVWLSEVGHRASLLGDEGQRRRLDASFDAVAARADIASLQWFTIADFGADETWGLFAGARKRPSHDAFVARAKKHAPPLAAKVTIEVPPAIRPGARVIAKVRATNLGTSVWRADDGVRLGAGAECPAAWAKNELAWDDAAGGYAHSATDARRFLSGAIAQGESIVIDVPVTAPSTPGKQRMAVRMVKEGVAWFGATATADVTIRADAPLDPPGPSPSPSGTSSSSTSPTDGDETNEKPRPRGLSSVPAVGGCSTAAEPPTLGGALALLGVLLLRLRRRT